jgi:hypothetical protein
MLNNPTPNNFYESSSHTASIGKGGRLMAQTELICSGKKICCILIIIQHYDSVGWVPEIKYYFFN